MPETTFKPLTYEERLQLMADNPPECGAIHRAEGYFDWDWVGCGFGQFSFWRDPPTGLWECDTEGMSPERVRKLLHAFADHVADQLTPIIEAQR